MQAAKLITKTRGFLLSGQREPRNKTVGVTNLGATTGTITFANPLSNIKPGVLLSIDLERFYVWSTNDTNQTALVEPAQEGTSPASHANGSIVTINAKFDDYAILDALNDDINDMSSPANGLFAVKTVDVSWQSNLAGYDLSGVTDMIGDPLELRYKQYGTTAFWPRIPAGDYDISRGMSAAEFPSTLALFVYHGGQQNLPIRVRYKAPFGTLTSLTDDVAGVTSLPATAFDIPTYGAAATLVAGREIRRNLTDTQSEPRRAEEVPPGAIANSPKNLLMRRQQRIQAEAARLAAMWPDTYGEG